VLKSSRVNGEDSSRGLLFGFGRMGITHIALLNKYHGRDIKWDVFEPSWKTRLLVRFFGDLAGLSLVNENDIRSKEYDLAVICSPPQFHQANYELVKNNAKRIFLEKPGFVEAKNEQNLYIGYVLRHAPCIKELSRRIVGKTVKKVSVEIRANTVVSAGTGWRASSKGGGVVNEFGSHAINLAKFLVKEPYKVVSFETQKIVSLACPDVCHLIGVTDSNVNVDIYLNWSDKNVRKPTYKVTVQLEDGSKLVTDLYQIWCESEDGLSKDATGVANWNTECNFYIRGLEFSEQARYFVSQNSFKADLEDSVFTDYLLRETA